MTDGAGRHYAVAEADGTIHPDVWGEAITQYIGFRATGAVTKSHSYGEERLATAQAFYDCTVPPSGTAGALLGQMSLALGTARMPATSGAANGTGGVGDVLKGLRTGSSSRVKLVSSADELEGLFGQLSAGGKPLEGTTYPGRLTQLPDGTRVGLRATSSSGGPTIDVHPPSGAGWKVHVEGGL